MGLRKNGVLYDCISIKIWLFTVFLRYVVCDAPASMIKYYILKYLKLYSGNYGCNKCNKHGDRIEDRVTFPICEEFVAPSQPNATLSTPHLYD